MSGMKSNLVVLMAVLLLMTFLLIKVKLLSLEPMLMKMVP